MVLAHPRKCLLQRMRGSRSRWPQLWLMTDARNDDILEQAIARLPRGSGIIFRHYHLEATQRAHRLCEVRKLAKRHGHLLFAAAPPDRSGIDGIHLRGGEKRRLRSMPHSAAVHDVRVPS